MGPGVGEGVLTVLPFLALSACTQDQLFADGLTDELIFAAQRTVGLRVTSRAVTFQYRQRECNLLALARETGSRAILHGTVRGDGVMLKVTAELTEPSGLLIWSDRFTAPDQERSLLEEEMAQRIVARLRTPAMTMSDANRCQDAERRDA
jgi:TolB-like protein